MLRHNCTEYIFFILVLTFSGINHAYILLLVSLKLSYTDTHTQKDKEIEVINHLPQDNAYTVDSIKVNYIGERKYIFCQVKIYF